MLSIHVLRPCHVHGAIFLATCNAILLLVDVKLANTRFHHRLLIIIFLTYQTFVTNLHLLRVRIALQVARKIAPCDRAFIAQDVVLNHTFELVINTTMLF